MSFFDNLEGTLRNTTNKVVAKTSEVIDSVSNYSKNASEEYKLKTAKNNLQNIVKEHYINLGKICYNDNIDNQDYKHKELVNEIKSKLKEIEDIDLQLEQMSNVVKCGSCNNIINPNDKFCSICGKPIPKAQNTKVCSNCKAAIDEDSVFCCNCGTKLETQEVSESENTTNEEN